MGNVDYVLADVSEWADSYQGPAYHALFCDSPYHLGPGGFMGKAWDAGKNPVAFKPATWEKLAGHLHPGAFIVSFGGARTFHRLAVAMEDAGLTIHPTITWIYGGNMPKATRIDAQLDAPDLAADWAGHRYGLQALKPAAEYIVIAQKPYTGRPIDNITQSGAGALSIEGGKVEPGGRWPSNVLLTHDPACNGVCVEQCPAKVMGDQSGISQSSSNPDRFKGYKRFSGDIYADDSYSPTMERGSVAVYGDKGTAARYFAQSDYALEVEEQLAGVAPFYYASKASRAERDAGLEDRPGTPNDFQRVTSGLNQVRPGREGRKPATAPKNNHPAVKPLKLTRYLAGLLLPPAPYAPRRLLVPFAGSASEAIGALLAGWEEVTAIEKQAEYMPIAKARIAYWQNKGVTHV